MEKVYKFRLRHDNGPVQLHGRIACPQTTEQPFSRRSRFKSSSTARAFKPIYCSIFALSFTLFVLDGPRPDNFRPKLRKPITVQSVGPRLFVSLYEQFSAFITVDSLSLSLKVCNKSLI